MSAQEYRRIIAVDFDGTLAVTKFPQIIKPIWKTIALCKYLQKRGAILILWICRCGDDLTEAVEWCKERGLVFDYINENVPENVEKWGNDSRKIFAHKYIDDKATNPAFGLAVILTLITEKILTLIKIFMQKKGETGHGEGKQNGSLPLLRSKRDCRGRRGHDRTAD